MLDFPFDIRLLSADSFFLQIALDNDILEGKKLIANILDFVVCLIGFISIYDCLQIQNFLTHQVLLNLL